MIVLKKIEGHSFISSLKNFKVLNCVDLGFHRGNFSKTLLKYNKNIKIFAIEGLKQFIKKTNKNINLSNFIIDKFSNKKKKIFVNVGNCPSVLFKKSKRFDITKTISLENFFKLKKIYKLDLLKIDIEGSEYNILNEKTIHFLSQTTSQITVEFHDFVDKKLTIRSEKIFKIFKKNNFFRINMSLDNTDVLFVNSKFIKLTTIDLICAYIYKYVTGIQRRLLKFFNQSFGL